MAPRRGRGGGGRSVDGIVVLDKPASVGSNEALQVVKRMFNARKAGHTGSLDRLATGLLPICFGEATKVSGFLLNADKRYQAVLKLGIRTSTGDAEGEVVETRPVGPLSRDIVERVSGEFRGVIEQIPPMYSAIKHKGQRLYKLAHQGIVVERKPRPVTIHALDVVEVIRDCVHIDVKCSKGTYIRTLAEDIGERIGCGARLESLRRVEAGPFRAHEMVTLEHLQGLARDGIPALDTALLPTDSALADWPGIELPGGMAFYVRQGQPVLVPHAPTQGLVRIYTESKQFIGVGEVLDDGRIAPRRLLQGSKKP